MKDKLFFTRPALEKVNILGKICIIPVAFMMDVFMVIAEFVFTKKNLKKKNLPSFYDVKGIFKDEKEEDK